MKRRGYLAGFGTLLPAISGCVEQVRQAADRGECTNSRLADPRERPCPALTHQPTKPTIGQSVVFDASESLPPPEQLGSTQTLFYLWKTGPNAQISLPEGAVYAAEGQQFTHRFETKGQHVIELFVTHSGNIRYSEEQFPNIGLGYESAAEVARTTEVVNVQKLKAKPLNLENSRVSISLKANSQAVSIDTSAALTFSMTNLVGTESVTAQLLLDVPTGLSVNQTSFNQGGSQFTSTYETEPGETVTDTLQISATETGPYLVTGYVVYTFAGSDTPNQTKTSEIELRFYE